MRIVMKTLACGPDFAAEVGQVLDVDDARGRDLVESGHAERLDTAAAAPAEGAPVADKRKRAVSRAAATRAKR